MTTSDETPIEAAGRDTPATAPDAAGRGTAGPAPSPAPPPRFVVAISLRLRRALRAAADAVVPAPVAMFEQIGAFMQTHMLRAAARLRLADLLAAGPASAAELAARAGVEAESLRRLLRGLATLGVFARGRDGRFRNNRASRTLLAAAPAAQISLRDCALYFGSEAQLRAWDQLEQTLAGGESGFERAHGMTTWEWFERHPEESEAFAGTMVAMTRLFAPGIATAYPFGEVRRLCDVGGGHGDLLAEILLRHPHLAAVLLDAGSVLATARPFLAARGVLPRIELLAGSFFEAVPAGCDAYLLKNVLHDWDDERAARVLDNCRRVMQAGHRLLVVETVVEEDTTREIGPISDLQMMVNCCGGRERGRAEYARLFDRTGFRLRRVVPAPGPMSVVEGLAV
ncbi:MAG TPA: methyltransferase [Thermoanaerobaculia bacterium]|nr:methyltransferase [Thermoanaerobaculia bacterium]